MEIIKSLFSLMFLTAFFIYLYWGIHIIRINPKERVNKAFLFLSLALCVWSFGYAVGNSAVEIETALFWRRIASVGRMALFSLILHFIILLTYPKNKLGKPEALFLLHIPAILLIYVFSLSSTMAPLQYNLMKIDYGWIDKPVTNMWNKLYYLYFLSYMLITLAVVMRWKRKIKGKQITRQANLIFKTMTIAVLFGGFLDILPSLILAKPLPQLSSIVILFPVGAMYHAARYYDVFRIQIVDNQEAIVTADEQKKIFTNLSIAICFSGLLAIFTEYFSGSASDDGKLISSIIKGAILFTIGLSVFFIQKIRQEKLKEMLTTLVLVSSIPIVMSQYINNANTTVWVFPIIIALSSLLFNKRTLLISSIIVAIITQRVVWILRPASYVLVDQYDFALRMIAFVIIFILGSYINKIYIGKIKENDYQISFQKLVSDISFDFIALNQENFDNNITSLLMRMGSFFQVDRAYIFISNYQDDSVTYSKEWCHGGIHPEIETIEALSLESLEWWEDQLKRNKQLCIENIEDLPQEVDLKGKHFLRRNVKSVVLVPILAGDEIQGYVGLDSVRLARKWDEDAIKRLKVLGNLLSSGMTQIKSDKEIEFMAYYDSLTKLPNRFLFDDRVTQAIHLSKRTGKFIAIVFIDLDNFKSVNDTIGHRGGDVLLKAVAEELLTTLRKTDTVARFGGDEFMIMLNHITDYEAVIKIVDKIMKLFSKTFIVNDQEFLVTASAGISISPVDGEDAETLIKNADIAMYRAKDKGKNQYVLCTSQMKHQVKTTMQLSNDLYRVLDRRELEVYYQPQIDLLTKQITGLEALLRWRHPTKGMISPGIFIPIAEKNSLINNIGEWVLKTACLQNKKWQDAGLPPVNIAINLSAIQIMNPNLPDNLENIIRETGLDPKYIELEITESIAIQETGYVIEVLNKLKKIGVSIAIDDFGTEYSSLSRLKLLPIDRIKIDMQFIQGLDSNEKDQAITMIIIKLAKSLGLNVLAEGVETQIQLEFLNLNLCDDVQGYFYYKPMPAEEIEKILGQISHK